MAEEMNAFEEIDRFTFGLKKAKPKLNKKILPLQEELADFREKQRERQKERTALRKAKEGIMREERKIREKREKFLVGTPKKSKTAKFIPRGPLAERPVNPFVDNLGNPFAKRPKNPFVN